MQKHNYATFHSFCQKVHKIQAKPKRGKKYQKDFPWNYLQKTLRNDNGKMIEMGHNNYFMKTGFSAQTYQWKYKDF